MGWMLCFSLSANALATSHRPQEMLESIRGTPNEGTYIVEHFCSTCHALNPQIPLGAPRMGVASDWQARSSQGMEVLLHHTEEGFGAMPARGGCFECTDEQLALAIAALLPARKISK
ncbi:cytochrome c5 [Legionella geestiana]|uniref:Cytochrome c5 n=1 Tax=Legionella geestiana TaxID=45065 RepID=A0A0W0TQM7_9GAMM|nr:cytochrome c5 [Legionella geestiana]STX53550.1 cytochrome c5 [Legionella geestiana]